MPKLENRILYKDDGTLDEVVTDGGAHLEWMDGNGWYSAIHRVVGQAMIDLLEQRGEKV